MYGKAILKDSNASIHYSNFAIFGLIQYSKRSREESSDNNSQKKQRCE
jgi:hypothetical protein